MISTFCGIEVKNPQKPTVAEVNATNNRPELRLFDAQLRLADAQEKALNSALMPKLGVFAQGYYGYPGLNMFEDMTRYEWSLNGIIGARLTWNIGALYTRKNDKAKLQLQRDLTESNREVFLFNNNLEQIQQNEEIARYRQLMADDEEIISLRSAVRQADRSFAEEEYYPTINPDAIFIPEPEPEPIVSCAGLQITEIYSSYEENSSEQFIELYNSLDSELSLDACTFRYKNKDYPLQGALAANSYTILQDILLTKDPSTSLTYELRDASGPIFSLDQPHGQKKGTSYILLDDQ
jgi:hypothetical protein